MNFSAVNRKLIFLIYTWLLPRINSNFHKIATSIIMLPMSPKSSHCPSGKINVYNFSNFNSTFESQLNKILKLTSMVLLMLLLLKNSATKHSNSSYNKIIHEGIFYKTTSLLHLILSFPFSHLFDSLSFMINCNSSSIHHFTPQKCKFYKISYSLNDMFKLTSRKITKFTFTF